MRMLGNSSPKCSKFRATAGRSRAGCGVGTAEHTWLPRARSKSVARQADRSGAQAKRLPGYGPRRANHPWGATREAGRIRRRRVQNRGAGAQDPQGLPWGTGGAGVGQGWFSRPTRGSRHATATVYRAVGLRLPRPWLAPGLMNWGQASPHLAIRKQRRATRIGVAQNSSKGAR